MIDTKQMPTRWSYSMKQQRNQKKIDKGNCAGELEEKSGEKINLDQILANLSQKNLSEVRNANVNRINISEILSTDQFNF